MAKIITTFLLLVISNYACGDDQEVGQALALLEKGESAYAEGKYEEAAQLYLASMQIRGTVRAASNLCNLFLYGQGVPQNYKTAMELCEAAAETGYPSALVMLGEMFLMGKGVTPNRTKALSYYRKGADHGHTHGQFVLGLELVKENQKEAIKYLKMAEESGYERAKEPLNEILERANK